MTKLHFRAFALCAALAILPGSALAAQAGDIAFTSFNADNESVKLLVLSDLAPNQTLFLTDNEWNGTAFTKGESYFAWNTGAGVAAGTVVQMSGFAVGHFASVGSLSRLVVPGSSLGGLSQTAETLYLYEGSDAITPSRFITAITNSDLTVSNGSLSGTELTVGVNAIQLASGSDSAGYLGALADPSELFNITQWQDRGDGSFNTPVPEASWPWMAAVGLGLLRLQRRLKKDSP
jgi:hypothetical protein